MIYRIYIPVAEVLRVTRSLGVKNKSDPGVQSLRPKVTRILNLGANILSIIWSIYLVHKNDTLSTTEVNKCYYSDIFYFFGIIFGSGYHIIGALASAHATKNKKKPSRTI